MAIRLKIEILSFQITLSVATDTLKVIFGKS